MTTAIAVAIIFTVGAIVGIGIGWLMFVLALRKVKL